MITSVLKVLLWGREVGRLSEAQLRSLLERFLVSGKGGL